MLIKFVGDDATLQALIEEHRQRFLEEASKTPERFDEVDVARIKNNDLWIRRFILPCEKAEEGYEMMRDAMIWRKEFGTNAISITDIPKEIHQMGCVFIYPPDANGVHLLYIRAKMFKPMKQTDKVVRHLLVHTINRIDELVCGLEKWAILMDATGAGLAQADLSILLFLNKVLREYFPLGCKQCVVYGLPWILKAFLQLILSLIPSDSAERVRVINSDEELKRMIPDDVRPDFLLNGECKQPYRCVPRGAKDAVEAGKEHEGMTEKEVNKYLKHFKEFIRPDLSVEIDANYNVIPKC